MQYCQSGSISPIRPIKTFPVNQVVEAFREMQKGQHIGKIVVSMPEEPAELEVTPTAQKLALRADASYLLCGGLGGLGRAISNWMVEHGARHLIYLSRSGGESESTQAFIRELEAQGCSVQTFKGDVANPDDVAAAVHQAAMPIAGVLHMSMVLQVRFSKPHNIRSLRLTSVAGLRPLGLHSRRLAHCRVAQDRWRMEYPQSAG